MGLGQQTVGTSNRRDFKPKIELYKNLKHYFFICKTLLFKTLGNFSPSNALFMTMHHLGLASVNNISRFLKCINYKHEKCLQPCFTFQFSKTSFGGLNFMKTPITNEERS